MNDGTIALRLTPDEIENILAKGSYWDEIAQKGKNTEHIWGAELVDVEALLGADRILLLLLAEAKRQQRIPGRHREVSNVAVYTDGDEIVVLGQLSNNDPAHNCDTMGCATLEHVLIRGKITHRGFGALGEIERGIR